MNLTSLKRLTFVTFISQVILLQVSRNDGGVDNFTFVVDESVKNLTVYITGDDITFTVISPTGDFTHLI